MATIVSLPGNPGPVNSGEQKVLQHLSSTLSDDVFLLANLTIPYAHPQTPEEYDIIAITPDAVFVIEVKDIAPDVEITPQQMIVGLDIRRNPYLATRIKAQKLKSKLVGRHFWFQTSGWVEHVVVFARKPASLKVCDEMKSRVILLEDLVDLIKPGTQHLRPTNHNSLVGRSQELLEAITDGATARVLPVVFGGYDAVSKIFGSELLEIWRARHRVSGRDVVLEVSPMPQNLSPAQLEQWRTQILQLFEIAQEIGAHPDIDSPRDAFSLENGAIVLVWPDREPNTFDHFLSVMKLPESTLTQEQARLVAAGLSNALAHLHSKGWILGTPLTHNVAVRSNGRGAVVFGSPMPKRSNDLVEDFKWLRNQFKALLEVCNDKILREQADLLSESDPSHRPSAELITFLLLSGHPASTVSTNTPLLERFSEIVELAGHTYGRTLKALDSEVGVPVLIKHEAGRPEPSWATREYRILSLDVVARSSHTVKVRSGGSRGGESYVATEFLELPNLGNLIDAGLLRDPDAALTTAVSILEALDDLHPDVEAITTLVESKNGVLDEGDQAAMQQLRNSGIAHNLLDPSNIFIHPTQGAILTDFIRAARFGEEIPDRTPKFWPPKQPVTISDPLADLFAVGALIIRMLATSNTETPNLSQQGSTSLHRHLVDVAMKAMSSDPNARFRTARSFIDLLISHSAVGVIPQVTREIMDIHRQIEALLAEGRFDDALKICPSDWIVTQQRIQEKHDLVVAGGITLLKISDVELRYVRNRLIPRGFTTSRKPYEVGEAAVYHSVDSSGGVIEVLVCTAETSSGLESWVQPGMGFGYPDRLHHAARSLRMSIEEKNGLCRMELSQARLSRDPEFPNQAKKLKASVDELSLPLGGANAVEIMRQFGATAIGTKQSLWGDKGKRKLFAAVQFYPDSIHLPAVAHFLTRIIPLYANFEEF